ncbi:MAG: heme anaerobic degradation radical SAM methyltransferase ChuW/HutW [Verrucomicrobiota bacterium]|nr:heme anaerobic degradation radical SAM methyltransferase ChuW/HutW [Verrucomicrobiota bacterium]
MKWTKEAEISISKIPGFIRGMIKQQVLKIAKEKGLTEITKEFLEEVRTTHGVHSKGKNLEQRKPKTIDDFYANTGKSPIYAGFKNKVSVHAGMSGTPIDDSSKIWDIVKNKKSQSAKTALYIHIPFCVARCKFCSFYQSKTNCNELDKYAEYLVRELELVSESLYAQSATINAIYFGGGTPTDLSADALRKILSHLNNNWNLANDCEITIEGRIHGFSDDKVSVCIDNGVNRFSFGVQSFDTKIRQQMGRIETQETVLKRIAEIAKLNKANISVDLIYGLPDQTKEIWLNDIETAAKNKAIDSASIYSLKFIPGSPIKPLVEKGKLSEPASKNEQAGLFLETNKYFNIVNAKRLGLRHWAFSNRERSIYNFIAKYEYDCIPIGNSAGGMINRYRILQRMEMEDYYAKITNSEKPIAISLKIPSKNNFTGAMIGSMEEFLQIDFNAIAKDFDIPDLVGRYTPLFEQWQEAGMISFNKKYGIMKLTEAGEFYNVNIAQNLVDFNKWSLNAK